MNALFGEDVWAEERVRCHRAAALETMLPPQSATLAEHNSKRGLSAGNGDGTYTTFQCSVAFENINSGLAMRQRIASSRD
jgi:hypothetical protein